MTDAHDTTTDDGKEPSNNTTRRRFLGYSAAVAALPAATGTATAQPTDNATTDDDGGVFTNFHAPDRVDFDTEYDVHSYGDDNNATVGVEFHSKFGVFAFDLTKAEARTFIGEIQAALTEGDA